MEKLKIGEHFFYRDEDYLDDIEFVVLDTYENSFYAITAEILTNKMPFDAISNSWKTSSLREWLNTEFANRMYHANLLCRHDNGITLLSKEEYEKYKHLIPKRNTPWWTRSPAVATASYAWNVSPAGSVDTISNICYEYGVRPVCTFCTVCMKIKDENGRKIIYYE